MLHQVSHAQGSGAAHASVAVHQRAAAARCDDLDLIRHLVEMINELSRRRVGDRDVDDIHFRGHSAAALRLCHVHDTGDPAPRH